MNFAILVCSFVFAVAAMLYLLICGCSHQKTKEERIIEDNEQMEWIKNNYKR